MIILLRSLFRFFRLEAIYCRESVYSIRSHSDIVAIAIISGEFQSSKLSYRTIVYSKVESTKRTIDSNEHSIDIFNLAYDDD